MHEKKVITEKKPSSKLQNQRNVSKIIQGQVRKHTRQARKQEQKQGNENLSTYRYVALKNSIGPKRVFIGAFSMVIGASFINLGSRNPHSLARRRKSFQ